ncbi:MAG: YCF48-related protein, partial [Candidatus Marinimicrobia bacterium]|nr:YCF48-related protein [Candidatus Neomarinimicrobiota bacterium]
MKPIRNLLLLTFVFFSIATSGSVYGSDLTGWVQRFLPPNGEDLFDVHYGNGVWVFVGDEGVVFRSTDGGVTQSSVTVPTSSAILSVHYGGNVWLAGDVSGSILRSTDDGLNWSSISISGFSTIRDIHYANGIWMLVGPSGKIFRSLDQGLNWTEITTPTSAFLLAISYADGIWIATGFDRTILRSTNDGLVWSEIDVSSTLLSGTPLYGVDSSGGGTWIAGGGVNSGAVIKSSDGGLTWSSRDVAGSGSIRAVDFANNEWRAVGRSGTLITSLDNGDNWSLDKPANINLTGIAWGDDRWLISGDSNTVLGSDDGTSFSLLTPRKSEDLFGISHNGDFLTAVGEEGTIVRSFNGSIWHDQSITGILENFFSIVDNESSSWAAIGGLGSNEVTLITNNNFASSGAPITNSSAPLKDIGLAGTTRIAVGDSGAIRRQKGSSFTSVWSHPVSGTSQSLNAVAAGNGVWISVGNQGTIIVSLDDGQTWSSRTSNTVASLRGLAYDSVEARWIAVGESGILIQSEDDGLTWTLGQTSTSETLENVVYGNGAWMAMGANGTLLYSTNLGSTWSSQALGVAVTLHDATYRDGEWWVVGDEGTIFQSSIDSLPEIVVQNGGSDLIDNNGTLQFSDLLSGGAGSIDIILTIRNTGDAPLTGLSASIEGIDQGSFSSGAFGATTLTPSASTTVTISFTP